LHEVRSFVRATATRGREPSALPASDQSGAQRNDGAAAVEALPALPLAMRHPGSQARSAWPQRRRQQTFEEQPSTMAD
jgi:hypothetical protein